MTTTTRNNAVNQFATSPAPRHGWSIADWCASVNISRAKLYTLPPELAPASVKIGKRHIIIEQPPDYLSRLSAAQAATVASNAQEGAK